MSDREPRFRFTSVREQLERADAGAVTQWHIPGILIKGGSTLLYAPQGSAKSLVTMDLAIAATTGREWMGVHSLGEPFPVAYVDDDGNNDGEFNTRLIDFGVSRDNPNLHCLMHQRFKITEDKDREDLLSLCHARSVQLVIFDSLRRIHDLNEKDDGQMMRVSAHIKEFCQAGISVLVLHHTTKNGKTFRGSSEIIAGADGALRLQKVNHGEFRMTNEKVRSVYHGNVWNGCTVLVGRDEEARLRLDGSHPLPEDDADDGGGRLRDRVLELLEDGPRHVTALRDALKLSSRDYPALDTCLEGLAEEETITSYKKGKAMLYLLTEDTEE